MERILFVHVFMLNGMATTSLHCWVGQGVEQPSWSLGGDQNAGVTCNVRFPLLSNRPSYSDAAYR